MSKSRIVLSFGVVAFIACCLPGCYKVTTFIENNGTEVTEVVSLTKDIQPIFNNSCGISGCHNSGGIKPNLSEGNSYNSIANGGYLKIGSPEASVLFYPNASIRNSEPFKYQSTCISLDQTRR